MTAGFPGRGKPTAHGFSCVPLSVKDIKSYSEVGSGCHSEVANRRADYAVLLKNSVGIVTGYLKDLFELNMDTWFIGEQILAG